MRLSLPFLLFAERQSQGHPQERLKAFEAFLLLTSLACCSLRKAFFRPLLFRMGRPFLFLSAKPPVFATTSGNQLDQTTVNHTAPCPPQTRTSGLERIPSSMEQSQSSATVPFAVYYDRRFATGRRYSRLGSKRRQLDAKPRFSSLFFEKAAELHKQPKGVADNQPGDESDCASGSNGSNHHRLFMRSVVPEQTEKPLQGLARDSKRPQDLVPAQPGPSPSNVAPASSSRSGRQAVPSNHRYFNVLPQPVSGSSLLSSTGVSASSRLHGNGEDNQVQALHQPVPRGREPVHRHLLSLLSTSSRQQPLLQSPLGGLSHHSLIEDHSRRQDLGSVCAPALALSPVVANDPAVESIPGLDPATTLEARPPPTNSGWPLDPPAEGSSVESDLALDLRRSLQTAGASPATLSLAIRRIPKTYASCWKLWKDFCSAKGLVHTDLPSCHQVSEFLIHLALHAIQPTTGAKGYSISTVYSARSALRFFNVLAYGDRRASEIFSNSILLTTICGNLRILRPRVRRNEISPGDHQTVRIALSNFGSPQEAPLKQLRLRCHVLLMLYLGQRTADVGTCAFPLEFFEERVILRLIDTERRKAHARVNSSRPFVHPVKALYLSCGPRQSKPVPSAELEGLRGPDSRSPEEDNPKSEAFYLAHGYSSS